MVKYIIDFILVITLIDIVVRDFKKKIILNKSNFLLLFLGIFLGILDKNLENRIMGAAIYSLPFFIIYGYGSDLFQKECLGIGDIKLTISLGLLLGFKGFNSLLLFLNISFISALTFIIVKYFFMKKLDKEIAFGPFLIIAFSFVKLVEELG
ncbi:MAG: prepilin peptidase [Cetobacterium sp.]